MLPQTWQKLWPKLQTLHIHLSFWLNEDKGLIQLLSHRCLIPFDIPQPKQGTHMPEDL